MAGEPRLPGRSRISLRRSFQFHRSRLRHLRFGEWGAFAPDPRDRSSWVHVARATYYVNKDMCFKACYQTRYEVIGSLSSPIL